MCYSKLNCWSIHSHRVVIVRSNLDWILKQNFINEKKRLILVLSSDRHIWILSILMQKIVSLKKNSFKTGNSDKDEILVIIKQFMNSLVFFQAQD